MYSFLHCRYCVSLGRKLLDPVMEYAGLMNVDEEYKLLALHPLQNMVLLPIH